MGTIGLILIGFWSYFLISYISFKLKVTKILNAIYRVNGFGILNIKHLLGIIIFGSAGYIFFQQSDIIFQYNFLENSALSLFIAFIATLSMDLSITDATSQNIHLPTIQFSVFNSIVYLIIRLLFLFTYEVFFRGLIFLFSLQYVNLVFAILINLFFYTLIHGFDSRKEIIGSIPFGIVLCLFTYYSQSIWPAFIIHASLLLGYEIIIISKGLTKTQKS